MKNSIIVILTCVAIVFSFFLGTQYNSYLHTSTTSSKDTITMWSVYSNTKWGFSMNYPNSWNIVDSKDSDLVGYHNFLLNLAPKNGQRLAIEVKAYKVDSKTDLLRWVKAKDSYSQYSKADFGVIYNEVVDTSKTFARKNMYIQKGDLIFNISSKYANDDVLNGNKDFPEIAKSILTSFKFTDYILDHKTPDIIQPFVYKMQNANWQLYKDPNNYFTIEFPPNWNVQKDRQIDPDFPKYYSSIVLVLNNNVNLDIGILSSKQTNGNNPKEIYLNKANGLFQEGYETLTEEPQKFTVIEPVYGDVPSGTKILHSIIKINEQYYTAILSTNTNLQAYLGVFNQILSTIHNIN